MTKSGFVLLLFMFGVYTIVVAGVGFLSGAGHARRRERELRVEAAFVYLGGERYLARRDIAGGVEITPCPAASVGAPK